MSQNTINASNPSLGATCSSLPLVPGLRALRVHPKTGRQRLVTQKNIVSSRNKDGILSRHVLSGSGGIVTFWPLSLSRGTSPVRMAPGSPFSPCNPENRSMKLGLASPPYPEARRHDFFGFQTASPTPLPRHDLLLRYCTASQVVKYCLLCCLHVLHYCLKAQAGVLQAPPGLLLLPAQHPHLNPPGTLIH